MAMTKNDTGTIVKLGRDAISQLRDIETRFKVIAGEDGKIDQAELQAGLGLHDADYAARIFSLIDRDGSGTVTLWEFIDFAQILLTGSPDEKLRIVFDLHDLNGDGTIDQAELTHILDRSLNEHHLDIPPQKLDALSEAMFQKVDADGSKSITFGEFKACIDAHPALKDQMVANSATWLRLPERIERDRRRPHGRLLHNLTEGVTRLWENERPWLVLLVLYFAANAWMFRSGILAEIQLGSDLFTQIAQGAAACLKLNGAIILIAMLRHSLTFLRRTWFGPFLPLDHAIAFHKIVGHVTFLCAVIHVGGYIGAYESIIDPDFFTRDVVYGELFKSRVGWTGLTLIGLFLVMWIFSLRFVRDKGLFDLFYITHQLYWLWFAFFLLHVPGFWMWVVGPGALYLIERGIRLVHGLKTTDLQQADALSSNVTRLRMTRPDWFHYQPGEYVFLKHPMISSFEWHPFTATSNPEETEMLELHVRGVGNWTHKLHDMAQQPIPERPAAWPRVYLDGPYGSPASDIFDSKIPVLIGAGIGVTPFASILRSILHQRQQGAASQMQRIYFIWMNRDQKAFEWFVDLMAQLEEDPATRDVIEIQVYLTGLRAELTSASLTVAMEVYHQETGRDLLTGLHAPTRLSRPNWQSVFKSIRQAHPDQAVDVFYCGPEGLSRVLSREAGRFDFGYKKENF
ncbi:MAG: ferric reductase [Rhodospirillaceae bacterium]|jgi:predicted ferric reductase/Ca2+-binding EF-hand superfamily protein|nr:ferric reductase [Rhodospirillaceae bacterium]|tara:strand:+ start:35012 stop:37063 length:2052 start_codon:yes stop_codon:yes gene_type:complete